MIALNYLRWECKQKVCHENYLKLPYDMLTPNGNQG